ncbi:hypothetical protein K2Z83_25380 [Oscillochloris sp. ZM17-4]|uniref:hypothetical protein n=1 Tax=Oscillochloris sp. ZM17-4 TaxID=2866714 RepID=UPI001C73A491|nr:hypothetical protein [Oscillochloris sp. ZM17-4]MBX0330991.1 hypothetical protein [Oscillochloris sp. ZM17-4]
MTAFTRHQCWQHERIGEVINKEAIAVDVADFMATHAPLGQIRDVRAGGGRDLSEADLLGELMRGAQGDRHIFAVIQGIPGTGKSHLIRWLHQRYEREMGAQDAVLLIERAQNSLLGTLRQIIAKLDIGGDALRQQIAKLRGAADSLSARAMKDSLLDNLRVATYEREESVKGKIRRNIQNFLLDPTVRVFLQREGGPIDRIAVFLTAGRQAEAAGDRPEFVADDFLISAKLLDAVIHQGYPEAGALASALDLKPDLREELAGYLNRLLDYAISRTVALSADDLRQTFNDLRRELCRQGKGLTLLIEDITAFTGIDQGLIDVLATQHTGEANRDFCRMTSVIGITDDYYSSRFPDNMRERITHHLTLDSGAGDQKEAGLLQSQAAAADLSARYLNAMRADRADITVWFEDGARADYLPNRCNECPHREPCHAAFGAVNIGPGDGPPVEVGLYPFNERAIWNVYRRLDSTTLARTPRSLLYHVILDLLQTHGPKVIAGSFPPPAKELAAGIPDRNLPALAKPVQQRMLSSQGGPDAQRIQSLILFWGDGTIDARGEGAARAVGTLAPDVFRAFGVRQIEGTEGEIVLPQPDPEPDIDPKPQPEPRAGTKYDADIERWRTGGLLEQYENLRKFLVSFIESAIDWTLHGVAAGVVDERIKPGRFEIEGQSGRAVGDRVTLLRSDDLAYVLQALADLNTYGSQLRPEALGAHMVTLGAWLRANEQQIISFVLQPSREQPSPMSLVEMLTIDCLMLDVLSDNLRNDATTSADLLRAIVKSAAVEVSDRPSSEQDWASLVDRARATHSRAWADLLRSIKGARARSCRTQLLKQLNQPQGSSSDIRFLDAATALDVIARLRGRDWALREIPAIAEWTSPTWKDAGGVYALLAARLDDLLADEAAYQSELLARLGEISGEDGPDAVMKAVDAFLVTLSDHGIPHNLDDPPGKAQMLRTLLQYLGTTRDEAGRATRAVRLSAGGRYVQQAHDFIAYLSRLIDLASKVGAQQDRTIAQLQAESDALRLEERTLARYDEILDLLGAPPQAAQPQEAQP